MPQATPEDLYTFFARAIAAEDRDAILSCYETNAVFVPRPGMLVRGREEVARALEPFLAIHPKLNLEITSLLEAEGVALIRSRWSLVGHDDAAVPVRMSGRGLMVLRRGPDGRWRFLLDSPFGAE